MQKYTYRRETVKAIDDTNKMLGLVSSTMICDLAAERGLDVVVVSKPDEMPLTVKLMDYGKIAYEKQKQQKLNRKKSVVKQNKTITFRRNIDVNDLRLKIKHAREFLSKGSEVRIECIGKGREVEMMELGKEKVNQIISELSDISVVKGRDNSQKRRVIVTLKPIGNKKK